MIKLLYHRFTHSFFFSFSILVAFIFLFSPVFDSSRHLVIFLFAASTCFSVVFGLVYPYLWNYSCLKSWQNILISSLLNTACGLIIIGLLSKDALSFILPKSPVVLVVNLIGHYIVFQIIARKSLNDLAQLLNSKIS